MALPERRVDEERREVGHRELADAKERQRHHRLGDARLDPDEGREAPRPPARSRRRRSGCRSRPLAPPRAPRRARRRRSPRARRRTRRDADAAARVRHVSRETSVDDHGHDCERDVEEEDHAPGHRLDDARRRRPARPRSRRWSRPSTRRSPGRPRLRTSRAAAPGCPASAVRRTPPGWRGLRSAPRSSARPRRAPRRLRSRRRR